MPSDSFQTIYPNPYIAGNPIRNKEMFFGRVDEFRFIERVLEGGKAALIVLYGERRSGKSSILYQILNGELGGAFLPIFIDMQIMAGIANDAEFFGRIIADTCKAVGQNDFSSDSFVRSFESTNSTEVFRTFLEKLKTRLPDRALLLLIDEYEILEAKILEGSLSPHVLTFFAGLLETEQVSFVFTGSKNLEARDKTLWGGELLQKATSHKISFLSEEDCGRLVTQPLKNRVIFTPEALKEIYTLTAGQPFYTQVICQNLVYHLNEVKKLHIESADVQAVVDGIIDNPPPQMLFNWSEHTPERKLTLSLLAEFSERSGVYLSTGDLCRGIARNKLDLAQDKNFFNTELDPLLHDEYVLHKERRYSFRVDLYRRWVRHDHSIWQVKKEIGARELARITKQARLKEAKRKWRFTILERSVAIILLVAVIVLSTLLYLGWKKQVIVKANAGPFKLMVDDRSYGTNKGKEDSTKFEIKASKGKRVFTAMLLADTTERYSKIKDIVQDNDVVEFQFAEYPVTIITNAESFAAELGGLKVETKGRPEAWKYTFDDVGVGKYTLRVKNLDPAEEKTEIIEVNKKAAVDTIAVHFDQIVTLTFNANARFMYGYEWSDLKGLGKNSVPFQLADSTIVTKLGNKKGRYQFTFKNLLTGEDLRLKSTPITSDTTIPVKFKSQPAPVQKRTVDVKKTPLEVATHLLKVFTDPPGATVFLNGVESDTTPFVRNLPRDSSYSIELKKHGYDPVQFEIALTANTPPINRVLQRQYGSLLVKVKDQRGNTVPDAEVFLNDEKLGKTPMRTQTWPVGQYQIKVKRSGYVTVEQSHEIKKDEFKEVPITLQKK